MEEHRLTQRRRVLRGGKILLNGRRSVIDCTVRNLSDKGACLLVDSVIGIPRTFELQIEGEADPRCCKLIWQSETRIGASFDGPGAKSRMGLRIR